MTDRAFPATRAHALEQLSRLGSPSSDSKNGPSRIGPYLRCRLVSEREAAKAALNGGLVRAPFRAAPLFERLLWGAYWKGWLEGRPQIYVGYLRQLSQDRRRWANLEGYQIAVEGRTGLSAFDAWNLQLLETGVLSHQERIWYASIWIFTLRLPWTLGADHFFRHLMDGDAAVNTLSWRWVAGLQPPGKPHLARAGEIEAFSKGRFSLQGRLQENASGLKGPPIAAARPLIKLPQKPSELLGERYGLFVTPQDLSAETSALRTLRPCAVVVAGLECLDDPETFAPQVSAFFREAIVDAKDRLAAHFQCPVTELTADRDPGKALGALLQAHDLPHLCYQQPATGPWLDMMNRLTARDVGLKYFPVRRRWDSELYPHATKSYLQFKEVAAPLVQKLLREI